MTTEEGASTARAAGWERLSGGRLDGVWQCGQMIDSPERVPVLFADPRFQDVELLDHRFSPTEARDLAARLIEAAALAEGVAPAGGATT